MKNKDLLGIICSIVGLTVFSLLFLISPVIFKVTRDFNGNPLGAVASLKEASRYHFTKAVQITSKDEFGDLGDSLVLQSGNIKSTISLVRNSSDRVMGAADIMNGTLNTLFRNVKQTCEQIQEQTTIAQIESARVDRGRKVI